MQNILILSNFQFHNSNIVLRAKAVLCPGLYVEFTDEQSGETNEWHYEDGLTAYLQEALKGNERLPAEPFTGNFAAQYEMVDWALTWLPENGEGIAESYVNLIPTINGGTHVNGLRVGLSEAMRDFCEYPQIITTRIKTCARRCLGKLQLCIIG